MTVTDHFAFLIEEADREFFQSVAADRAVAAPLGKTAAAVGVDKLASQVEAELVLLERSGPVGVALGMTKRAMAHLERLADDPRLIARPSAMPGLFGKVAAQAIAKDLAATTSTLCKLATPEEEPEVRRELAKLGLELAGSLEELRLRLEKSAAGLGIGGLGRAGLIAKELRGASNLARGAVGAAEEGIGRIGRKLRAGQALRARANVRQIGQEMAGAAQAGRSTGAARAIAEGQRRQIGQAEAAYAARRRAAVAKSPAGAAVGSGGATGNAPPSPTPGTPPSALKTRAARGRAPGRAQPDGKAGLSGPVDLLKKLHGQGWGALSPKEKTHVVGGGLGLVEGHRLMTGRDLITGEKDDQ